MQNSELDMTEDILYIKMINEAEATGTFFTKEIECQTRMSPKYLWDFMFLNSYNTDTFCEKQNCILINSILYWFVRYLSSFDCNHSRKLAIVVFDLSISFNFLIRC